MPMRSMDPMGMSQILLKYPQLISLPGLSCCSRRARSLWSALKPDADRVILCEYEAMFSGDAARRLARFQIIFDVLGIPRFGKLPDSERPLVFQKAMHFIDPQKQKMTDPDYAARFVSNYAEIAQRYDNWLMRSYGKTSLA